ncbi:hypothetical protein JHV675_52190 [Mycobacterium avium subsp. hominissuis]
MPRWGRRRSAQERPNGQQVDRQRPQRGKQLPWLPLLAPLGALAIYLLAIRPFLS